jgi:hypothetical protein
MFIALDLFIGLVREIHRFVKVLSQLQYTIKFRSIQSLHLLFGIAFLSGEFRSIRAV